jgi:hypothetical protein
MMELQREAGTDRKVQPKLVFPLALFFLLGSVDRANVAFAGIRA